MSKILKGECLCGAVSFELEDDFKAFYQCHCRQCQQLTGSAFASNLFTSPGNIRWTDGREYVSSYVHPSRDFSNSFCAACGSALPFETKSGESLIVPAGSLRDQPSTQPQANIFVSEEACWLKAGADAPQFSEFQE